MSGIVKNCPRCLGTMPLFTNESVCENCKVEEGKTALEDFPKHRIRLWIDTYAAVAGCFDCQDKRAPLNWANRAVEHFDQTFTPELVVPAGDNPAADE